MIHDYIKISRENAFLKNLIITWSISSICNYKCSYCCDYSNDGKFKFPTTYKPMIDFLKDIRHKYPEKEIQLCITNGEPTLWKLMPQFIRECHKIGICVHIDTNGSKDLVWWIDNVEYFHNISMSFHPQLSDKDHIYSVLKNITKLKLKENVSLSLLMLPDFFEYNYSFGTHLVNELDNLSVSFKPVRLRLDEDELYPYSELQKSTMSKYLHSKKSLPSNSWTSRNLICFNEDNKTKKIYRNDIVINKQNSWKGWNCNAGIESFQIHLTGEVYRCAYHVGGSIGNINKKVILPKKSVTCDHDYCSCVQDISNTKWR